MGINSNNNLQKRLKKEELKNITSQLKDLVADSESDNGILKVLGSIMEMKDEDVSVLGPGIIQSFQQSLNNPNDRIILTQALNASGGKAEDLILEFSKLAEEIDNWNIISQTKKDFIKELIGSLVNTISETEGISKRLIQIPIELCHEDAKIPQYANVSDSGMDVFALNDYTINPGETQLIPTGIKLAIPPGYEIQVRPKSGRALKTKLRVANTPGTVDAGYRDEIKVIVENVEPPIKDIQYHYDDSIYPPKMIIDSILHGSSFTIGKGEKFCQLVLMEVPKAALYRVEKVAEIGENRGGGFGSTGLT